MSDVDVSGALKQEAAQHRKWLADMAGLARRSVDGDLRAFLRERKIECMARLRESDDSDDSDGDTPAEDAQAKTD